MCYQSTVCAPQAPFSLSPVLLHAGYLSSTATVDNSTACVWFLTKRGVQRTPGVQRAGCTRHPPVSSPSARASAQQAAGEGPLALPASVSLSLAPPCRAGTEGDSWHRRCRWPTRPPAVLTPVGTTVGAQSAHQTSNISYTAAFAPQQPALTAPARTSSHTAGDRAPNTLTAASWA